MAVEHADHAIGNRLLFTSNCTTSQCGFLKGHLAQQPIKGEICGIAPAGVNGTARAVPAGPFPQADLNSSTVPLPPSASWHTHEACIHPCRAVAGGRALV